MQTKEINYKGRKIRYLTKGEGPLVVLLHGFGEDGSIWTNQFDVFPEKCLLIPDLPGSGESEMIDDMSMEGLADAVKAVIDFVSQEEKKEKITMIGHSMGGYVTLAYTEKYHQTLNAFGLFHSTAYADSEEKKQTRRKGIAFIEQHGGWEFLKTSVPNLFAPVTKERRPELIEEHLNRVRNFSGAALVRYYESMIQRPDRTDVLRDSRVPVLFVLGRHDAAVPLEDSLRQCHLPQLSYIELLENSGHMGMLEEVERSNKILSQFMTTVEKTT